MSSGSLRGFAVSALCWLAVLLPAWFFWLAKPTVWPVAWLAEALLQRSFAWVTLVEMAGYRLTLHTHLLVTLPQGAEALLTPEVNAFKYGYGLPLFVALMLAARPPRLLRKLLLGCVLLMPVQTWGICFDWLVQIAGATPQLGWAPWQQSLIQTGYNLGFLAFPALAPLMLWLPMNRPFIAGLMLEQQLGAALPPTDSLSAIHRHPIP